jgi:hypothetical protein
VKSALLFHPPPPTFTHVLPFRFFFFHRVLSFVDPTNLTMPERLVNLSHVFSADKRHTVLVSIGGESFANK